MGCINEGVPRAPTRLSTQAATNSRATFVVHRMLGLCTFFYFLRRNVVFRSVTFGQAFVTRTKAKWARLRRCGGAMTSCSSCSHSATRTSCDASSRFVIPRCPEKTVNDRCHRWIHGVRPNELLRKNAQHQLIDVLNGASPREPPLVCMLCSPTLATHTNIIGDCSDWVALT